jgi:hypothetical protein
VEKSSHSIRLKGWKSGSDFLLDHLKANFTKEEQKRE